MIYLIGIPAVGKYTIAKEIARLTQAKLVDNRLINLPVFSILGYDGQDSFPFPSRAWDHIETIFVVERAHYRSAWFAQPGVRPGQTSIPPFVRRIRREDGATLPTVASPHGMGTSLVPPRISGVTHVPGLHCYLCVRTVPSMAPNRPFERADVEARADVTAARAGRSTPLR